MAKSTPDKVAVTVRVDKAHAAQMDQIVGRLEASGLSDVERHDRFLIVNGFVPSDQLANLRLIDGIASVREDATYKPQTEHE